MSRYLAIIAADCHIDYLVWRTHPSLRHDAFVGFRQVVDLAIKHKCPLLLAGDVIECLPEENPTSEMVEFISTQTDRLKALSLDIGFIEGQHDRAHPPWFSSICPHATWLSEKRLKVGKFSVAGIDYQPTPITPEFMSRVPAADIYLTHQTWKEFANTKYGATESLEDCFKGKTVVNGDIHKFKRIRRKGYQWISPGATHARRLDEPVEHFALGVVAGAGGVDFKRIRLCSRPRFTYALSSVKVCLKLLQKRFELAKEWQKLTKIPEIATPIVKFYDDGVGPIETENVAQSFSEIAFVFVDRKSPLQISSTPNTNLSLSLVDSIRQNMSAHPEAAEAVIAMNSAPSPAQILRQLREQFLSKSHANNKHQNS